MELNSKQIRHKQKKAKTESEYENAAFHKSKRISTGHENYYDEVETLSVQNLEIRIKAQPNEYSKWNNESSDLYANQGAVDESSQGSIYGNQEGLSEKQSENETKLPLPVSPSASGEYAWKISAFVFAFLFVGTGIAFAAVTWSLYTKVSPCDGIGCFNNGTCSVYDDKLVCDCPDGFSGHRCEVTPCDDFPCEHMGSCFVQDLKPQCSCLPGFSGANCSVTPCDGDPCLHDGSCTYSINDTAPACSCMDGYYGNTCEITPCFSDPCLNDGTCAFKENNPKPICTCKNGFYGSLCEETPCTSSPCDNYGTCIVSGSSYKCNCPGGYTGLQCTDMYCSAEDYQYCMFDQDLFDYGTWQRENNTNPPYYFSDSNAEVRFISQRTKLNQRSCVSFAYEMTRGIATAPDPSLTIYENNSNIWSSSTVVSWITFSVNLTVSIDMQIVFEANRQNSSNTVKIRNIRIHRC